MTITGIEDIENVVESIWPNPTSGQINVKLNNNNSPVDIIIYDVNGRLVSQKHATTMESLYTIEIPGKSGIYYVNIRSNLKVE